MGKDFGMDLPIQIVERRTKGVLYRSHIFPCVHCRAGFNALQIQALASVAGGVLCRNRAAQRCYEKTV